jgi:hypothetical protein
VKPPAFVENPKLDRLKQTGTENVASSVPAVIRKAGAFSYQVEVLENQPGTYDDPAVAAVRGPLV